MNKLDKFFESNNNIVLDNIKKRKKSKLIGLSLDVRGRIGKSDRSRSIRFMKGKIKKNNLNIFTHSFNFNVPTKTGIWMFKVNLLRV